MTFFNVRLKVLFLNFFLRFFYIKVERLLALSDDHLLELGEAYGEVFEEVLVGPASPIDLYFCLLFALVSLHEFKDQVEILESNLASIFCFKSL